MLISVFTSCYNQSNYLPYAIESVLNQTYTNFEYLLYDDGSTDDTWSIIMKYAEKDKRIIPIKLEKEDNVGIVINKSIEKSTGEIWTWCPSDDVWNADLLQTKINYYMKYPNAVLYHDWDVINKNGIKMNTVITTKYTPEQFKEIVWSTSPIGFTGIFIPFTVFENTGKFPEHLKFSEDFYWMIKATIHDIDFIGISKVLHQKRTHSNTLTRKNSINMRKHVYEIRNELKSYRDSIAE
jgi:teichuronic acid biosynthesis glycosyltransferase TuaG